MLKKIPLFEQRSASNIPYMGTFNQSMVAQLLQSLSTYLDVI